MLNSRSKYEQIGVSNTFLRHTQKKLFTFKNSPVFFGPPCILERLPSGKRLAADGETASIPAYGRKRQQTTLAVFLDSSSKQSCHTMR